MKPKCADGRLSDSWVMRAHDVRDVSARVYLAAEELSNSTDERTRKLGTRILSACDRIVDICEDATKKHVDNCHGTIGQTMHMVNDLATSAAGPETQLHLHIGCDAPIIRDGVGLFRILANLLNNAVTAVNNAGGGSIIIRSTQRAGKAMVVIENVSREPSDVARKSKSGSGLGLLIASGLAQDIGARLERCRSCSEGTVYSLQLASCMAPVSRVRCPKTDPAQVVGAVA